MSNDYSIRELYSIYMSLCDVSDKLRSDQCYCCGKLHADVVCKCAYFCNSLSTFKAQILDEFSKRLREL